MTPEEFSTVLEKVNKSGFPLQMGLADLVRAKNPSHSASEWDVAYEESAWRHDQAEADGYIDLVLIHQKRKLVLCVECKRDLEGLWVFLVDKESAKNRKQAKYWLSIVRRIVPGGPFDPRGKWVEIPSEPSSVESKFCVVSKRAAKDNNNRFTLEQLSSELSLATERLAVEERPIVAEIADPVLLYASVIVTTADLVCCHINSEEMALEDGTIPPDSAKSFGVNVVRFRKQLSTHEKVRGKSRYELNREKERTVWVVSAKAFLDFLSELEPDMGEFVLAQKD